MPEKIGRSKSSRPNPYTTLPAKTTSYIQLRFQLMNFANVYRIVKLPVTFTFANLHTLIQYMFGWSNSHLHRAEVVSYVVMHDPDSDLAGTMKRWGRMPTLGEYLAGEEEQPGDRISWKFERDDNPIYHVDERGVRPDYGFGKEYAKSVKDSHLKLGEIWTVDFEKNASRGESPNDEIGIIYEYDLGDSWTVHISCDPNELFFVNKTPINIPVIEKAHGAPPIEHAPEFVYGEDDANDKTVSNRIFVGKNFELYCEGKLMSCARRTELAIYTPEEEAERQKRLQRERDERMDVDSDEENYNEYDDDDSGEWY
ncbi:hypothetical protein DEU56DRAFT_788438 [Suillus clintonianus]|uniref:uncharacterized protein n=1 Tax=Suillus clintonianus TaxID=1904413 RepID=UPI001B86F551|nr:uncharacterized protein DEU56DRAFT_788438 [Suillus clintonianus]KAG2145844.1 hypothetical protein DEU56DRAFT_788438 [Suillus clintonianus]